jgi:hypothetical protein
MLQKKVVYWTKEFQQLSFDLIDKEIINEKDYSEEFIKFLEQNEYNYYIITFDKNLSLKNLYNNLKQVMFVIKEKIILFVKNLFSKDLTYINMKDQVWVYLNKWEDKLQFEKKLFDYNNNKWNQS